MAHPIKTEFNNKAPQLQQQVHRYVGQNPPALQSTKPDDELQPTRPVRV